MALLDTATRHNRGAGRPSRERLKMVGATEGAAVQVLEDQSFAERVIRPFFLRFTSMSNVLASKSMKDQMREKLMRAGFPGQLRTEQIIAAKYMFAMVLPLVGCGLVFAISVWRGKAMDPGNLILAGAPGLLVGYMLPDFMLNRAVKKRQKEIMLSLPDMIDLLAVAVEAGLAFDAAIQRVGERFKGALGEEFQRARQEVALGRSRAEALREMCRRCEVPDLNTFVTALIQAEQLGVSLANVLRVQSVQMRERRSQRAREQAQKAPVKMMIPLVLFIFPTLFIVIMGPAAIKSMEALKSAGIF